MSDEQYQRHRTQILGLQRDAASAHLAALRTSLLLIGDSLRMLMKDPEVLDTPDAREKLAELKMMLGRVHALLP